MYKNKGNKEGHFDILHQMYNILVSEIVLQQMT